jgi:hypothetical protein
MRWAGHVASMGAIRDFCWETLREETTQEIKCRWDNIRNDLRETVGVKWMHLAQDRDQWQHPVNIIMKLWVP